MPQTFPCPRCQTELSLASDADFQAFCPACATTVPAPWIPQLSLESSHDGAATPAEQATLAPPGVLLQALPVEQEQLLPTALPVAEPVPEVGPPQAQPVEPRPAYDWGAVAATERPKAAPAWGRVSFGLTLVASGGTILFLALLFLLLFGAIAAIEGIRRASPDGPLVIGMGPHPESMISAEFLLEAEAAALLIGGLLLISGKMACCGAPAESGLRGLAWVSAFFALVALVALYGAALVALSNLTRAVFGLDLRAQGGGVAELFELYGFLAGIALAAVEMLLFLLFLRGVGRFFENRGLSRGIVKYFLFALLAPLLPALLFAAALFLETMRATQPRDLELLHWQQFCVALIPLSIFAYVVALCVWYVLLVRSARDTVVRARLGRLS
jgi:hypothetical protein